MAANNTRQIVKELFKKHLQDNKFDKSNLEMVYRLGKIIENTVPDIIDKKKQNYTTTFKYVSWKWYEFILRELDKDFWWELSDYSDNYQMVQCKIVWLGKEYYGWYAVENSAVKKDTKEPLNNLGEMVVNENMRCFAKLASRATGLFLHLWYENDESD